MGYSMLNGVHYGNGGTSSGGDSSINYSTEEKKIGTWIDGSDLFRKTIKIIPSSLGTWLDYSLAELNIQQIVSYSGVYSQSDVIYNIGLQSSAADNSDRIIVYYTKNNLSLSYYVGTEFALNGLLILTIEYTKKSGNYYNIVTKSIDGSEAAVTINKYINSTLVESTDVVFYDVMSGTSKNIDNVFTIQYPSNAWIVKPLRLLEFDGANYNVGDDIPGWAYNVTVSHIII